MEVKAHYTILNKQSKKKNEIQNHTLFIYFGWGESVGECAGMWVRNGGMGGKRDKIGHWENEKTITYHDHQYYIKYSNNDAPPIKNENSVYKTL